MYFIFQRSKSCKLVYSTQNRPIIIEVKDIQGIQEEIDVELVYYFKHVVSEIQQFYPDEYEMFASGQTADFVELASLVESIENYGNTIGEASYFWNEIKSAYPTPHAVLHRIKIDRHAQDHLTLKPSVDQKYREFWNEDTKGVTDLDEQKFVIQQKILESFLTAIQLEIATIA